ncbi:MAG: hypothetical protein M3Q93_12290 [Gemmatimonadota bacterium]|nr:hypothetical protein [Gemmatimonadota bacterium]
MIGLADRKVGDGHRQRRGAVDRLVVWGSRHRARSRPLAWFHAASVGEGLQAESVLLELRRLVPTCQFVFTHFSPSAEPLARRLDVDVADYLPYDRPAAAARLLEALAPDLLVFAKVDLWPELATRAARQGVTVAIVAGTVSDGSGRLRWPARKLLAPGYQAVRSAAAVATDDARRLTLLGVPPERIQVLGDPRFDSVTERVRAVSPHDPLLSYGAGAPTLVAGSTWPGDEAVLLEAFARLRLQHEDARLILAPHEPTADRLDSIERAAVRAGLPAAVRLSAAAGPASLLLVDRVGILAVLYGAGSMAYVGGGFGRAGLHSVLEPAAWGVPVVFGPRWNDSRDAALLIAAEAAEALPGPDARAAVDRLHRRWLEWMEDEPGRQLQGRRAAQVVDDGLGAARRSAELLAALLPSRAKV